MNKIEIKNRPITAVIEFGKTVAQLTKDGVEIDFDKLQGNFTLGYMSIYVPCSDVKVEDVKESIAEEVDIPKAATPKRGRRSTKKNNEVEG